MMDNAKIKNDFENAVMQTAKRRILALSFILNINNNVIVVGLLLLLLLLLLLYLSILFLLQQF